MPALMLGIAFGGFFDGIVLHQILQWHHLLSGLSSGRWSDLRLQLLADGLFHAMMYGLAAAAVVVFWRREKAMGLPGARDEMVVGFVGGFALWHLIDAVFSHGLLGIHRIRMDSTYPLAWDLGWLLVFGGGPALWAQRRAQRLQALRRAGSGGGGTLMILLCVSAAAALLSLRSPADSPSLVLLDDASRARALLTSLHPQTRIVGSDPSGTVWVFSGEPPAGQAGVWVLQARGLLAGCASWLRI